MIALEKWGLLDRVVGTVWDTTSSNSGQHQGTAALIESELIHAFLWFACWRHVLELHITHASRTYMRLSQSRKSPDDPLFKRSINRLPYNRFLIRKSLIFWNKSFLLGSGLLTDPAFCLVKAK